MNAMRALELLAFQPLSAPELAASLQIDQRTVRRMLKRLLVDGYVAQTGDYRRRYRATLRLSALGRQVIAQAPFPRACARAVGALAEQAGATTHLWIPHYRYVVCVLRAEAATRPNEPQPMLGELVPAHASAAGKVLLAHRRLWCESVLSEPLERHTKRTLVDPRDLGADLKRVRSRGYATEHGEHRAEAEGIAAPIFVKGEVTGALGVSTGPGPRRRLSCDALASLIAATAAALTASLLGADA
jgi:IclR family acetate operon transcriptional repressor